MERNGDKTSITDEPADHAASAQVTQTILGWPRWAIIAAMLIVTGGVIGIIGMAFRGSWGALKDAALAIHYDFGGADLFPFSVDGLIVIATVAALMLYHIPRARRYCLTIVGVYTAASWGINVLHGFGMFAVDPATGLIPTPPWPVVLVVASLAIGTIALGSHLLVYVFRYVLQHLFTTAAPKRAQKPRKARKRSGPQPKAENGSQASAEPDSEAFNKAVKAYEESRQSGNEELSQRDLVKQFGISKRKAGEVQQLVKSRELAASNGKAPVG